MRIARPIFVKAKREVINFYAKPGNECGGRLHIVLDDGNIDIDSIKFCIALAWDKKDADAARLGFLLLELTPRERYELYSMPKNQAVEIN